MRTIGRPGKNIRTLSYRATKELYAKVPSHRALCEGSMRIELRSELYAALQSRLL